MAAFTDKKGRTWTVDLDLRIARVIDKSDFKQYWDQEFSILSPDSKLLTKLITDAPFLFAVIWAMVQEQAEAKYKSLQDYEAQQRSGSQRAYCNPPTDTFPISPKEQPEEAEVEFVSGINGPTIEAARNAIVEAVSDFFPETRTVLSALRSQIKMMGEKAAEKMEKTVPLLQSIMDEEFELRIEDFRKELSQSREKRLGERSIKSLASSE